LYYVTSKIKNVYICFPDFTANIRIIMLTEQIQYNVYAYSKINVLSQDTRRDKTVVEDLS